MKRILLLAYFHSISIFSVAQGVYKTMLHLPDTGQNSSYTTTIGEDCDYSYFAPSFNTNTDGTVCDNVTGLMWQKKDGGEMTFEMATIYCDTLTLGGFADWRLPNAHESFSILNMQLNNPAIDAAVFTPTGAEYWWTSDKQKNDSNKIWVTNAGGGIGNHPKSETISAGGSKKFHVRAVRDVNPPVLIPSHFTDNGNGTITDNFTQLVWQKTPYNDTLTWEQALVYADTVTTGASEDWRLPNIKELQSINDEERINPSLNTNFFNVTSAKKYWSSTTLPNQTTKAWYLSTQYGITTYETKTNKCFVLCVKGNQLPSASNPVVVADRPIVFPNPFSAHIFVKNTSSQAQYQLFNELGQLLFVGTDIEQHNFSTLPNGKYYLKIDDRASCIFSLVKQ